MNTLFEFVPLLLFLGSYLFTRDLYVALGVLMVAMPIGLILKYFKTRKVDKLYLWSTILLIVAGAATFYFDDPRFLYWKPTALYWAVSVAFLLSSWIGERPLVQRFFGVAAELPLDQLTPGEWQRLNIAWVVFFAAMGILNIYVAFNYPEDFWVKFKVFGLLGLTLVFTVVQTFWVVSKLTDTDEDTGTTEND